MSLSKENLLSSYRILDRLQRPTRVPGDGDEEEMKKSISYLVLDGQKTRCVLKVVDLESFTNLSDFIKDILWYKQLNHWNLMNLRDCFLLETKLYLIKPYAVYGSCSDLLAEHPFGLRESLIAPIVWQVVQALRYLHDRHLIHRAVASKNIYLCENGRVLLDNFSHCISMISPFDGKLRRHLHEYNDQLKDQILYLAPEVIFQNASGYNFKSDVYSLGTVACELANGSHAYLNMPFENLTLLYLKIQNSKPILLDQSQLTDEMLALQDDSDRAYVEELRKRQHSKEFHSFVNSCLIAEFEQRSSVDDLLVHPFLKHPKKLSADPQALAEEIVKQLGSDRRVEKSHSERQLAQEIDASCTGSNSFPLSWEF